MSAWWIFAFYFAERSFELWLARRNRRKLLAGGAREFAPQSYRRLVAMHLLFFVSLMIESWPWRIPLDAFTFFCLAVLLSLQILRYWCIASLGEHWNTRIIVVPGKARIRRGPYRWLRHPNYLAVTLEIAFLPLLLRAPGTFLLFTLANLVLLRERVGLEEQALRKAAEDL